MSAALVLGEITGEILVPALLIYWVYRYLKKKEDREKKEAG